jgi:hypothetical protein
MIGRILSSPTLFALCAADRMRIGGIDVHATVVSAHHPAATSYELAKNTRYLTA